VTPIELESFAVVVATHIEPCAAVTRGTAEEKKMTVQQTSPPWDFVCNPDDESMCANVWPGRSGETNPDDEIDCLYHPGQAIIKQKEGVEFDPAALGFVPVDPIDLLFEPGNLEDGDVDDAQRVLEFFAEAGVGVFKLEGEADLFEMIDEVQSEGHEASPHYQFQPAPRWRYGPYNRPVRIDPPWTWKDLASTGPSSGEQSARLVIIDTGSQGNPATLGLGFAEPEVTVDPRVVGHGTFAASVALQYNPSLQVDLYRASWQNGVMNEASVTAAFLRAHLEGSLDDAVVNLSLGTYPCGPRYHPVGLPIALARPAHVVAASGNDGHNFQLYPASDPDVIGVSAYDTSWSPASWANKPGDEYAPGEDVVGWYHDGTDESLAVWSGTSFATPYHAACIASGVC
jgi:Subtilase family